MKIRQGFVSNSSSSSFVIFCKPISRKDIFSKKNTYPIYAQSDYGNEGIEFFELTPEMLDYIAKKGSRKLRSFYEVADMTGDNWHKLSEEVLKDKTLGVMPLSIDHYNPTTLQEFIEGYGGKDDED